MGNTGEIQSVSGPQQLWRSVGHGRIVEISNWSSSRVKLEMFERGAGV